MEVASLIRDRRRQNGLTQAQLAVRAGTTQAAISRLERGLVSPTFETLERLLEVMGEAPEVHVRRMPGGYDPRRLASLRTRSPEQRLLLAFSWNKLAGQFARAGARARCPSR